MFRLLCMKSIALQTERPVPNKLQFRVELAKGQRSYPANFLSINQKKTGMEKVFRAPAIQMKMMNLMIRALRMVPTLTEVMRPTRGDGRPKHQQQDMVPPYT